MQMLLRIRISGKARKATILVICNHLLRSQKILWQGREGGSGGRLHLGVLSSPQHRGGRVPGHLQLPGGWDLVGGSPTMKKRE